MASCLLFSLYHPVCSCQKNIGITGFLAGSIWHISFGSYIERLGEIMKEQAELPSKRRSTAKKIYESLQREGYIGGYDAVRRYIQTWKEEHRSHKDAYIPLQYGRGEAFQFDWSEEIVEIGGVERKVQVAQFRLC